VAKNFKKRRDKKWKKKAKKNKTSLLSSSGQESEHYEFRSVSKSGFFQPIRKRVIKKERTILELDEKSESILELPSPLRPPIIPPIGDSGGGSAMN